MLILLFLFALTSCEPKITEVSKATKQASLNIKGSDGRPLGTGFVIKGNWIITNYHVVKGFWKTLLPSEDSSSIFVSEFDSKNRIKTTIKYHDEYYDIAVLETHAKFDHYLTFNTEKLKEGTKVYACGSGRGGAEGTFTTGSVTGYKDENVIKEGKHPKYLQHDAGITFGNSGGPLVDRQGKLVGVNTAVGLSSSRGNRFYDIEKNEVLDIPLETISQSNHLAFALPANTLKGILESENLYDDSLTFNEFIDSYIILIVIIFIFILSYIIYLILQKRNIDKGNRRNKVFKPKNLYGK